MSIARVSISPESPSQGAICGRHRRARSIVFVLNCCRNKSGIIFIAKMPRSGTYLERNEAIMRHICRQIVQELGISGILFRCHVNEKTEHTRILSLVGNPTYKCGNVRHFQLFQMECSTKLDLPAPRPVDHKNQYHRPIRDRSLRTPRG